MLRHFFDDAVYNAMKRKKIDALMKQGDVSDEPPKRIHLDQSVILEKELDDFVTSRTLSFFIMGLNADFLMHADLRLRNDLYCVGWGAKLYSPTPTAG